ncbi:unnamed protein product [Ranitomeya imitator]|uniref:Vomeronasal type-1 receptor n=1 Tax=Ranitomeya imitator TaxID=111125 RepID=A0ABN9MLZ7_9NEOB|nr:unnamed protein product [Ranitomeya imitator]
MLRPCRSEVCSTPLSPEDDTPLPESVMPDGQIDDEWWTVPDTVGGPQPPRDGDPMDVPVPPCEDETGKELTMSPATSVPLEDSQALPDSKELRRSQRSNAGVPPDPGTFTCSSCGSVFGTDVQQRARTDYVTTPSHLSDTAEDRATPGPRSRKKLQHWKKQGLQGPRWEQGLFSHARNKSVSRMWKQSSGAGTPERSVRPHVLLCGRTLRSEVLAPELGFHMRDTDVFLAYVEIYLVLKAFGFIMMIFNFIKINEKNFLATNTILMAFVVMNLLIVISQIIPQFLHTLGVKNLMDDTRCQIFLYTYRVSRAMSICITSLLSCHQCILIAPSAKHWIYFKQTLTHNLAGSSGTQRVYLRAVSSANTRLVCVLGVEHSDTASIGYRNSDTEIRYFCGIGYRYRIHRDV